MYFLYYLISLINLDWLKCCVSYLCAIVQCELSLYYSISVDYFEDQEGSKRDLVLLSRQVSVSLCYEIDVFFFFQASCWCLAHGLSLEFFAIFVEGLQNLSFMYVLYCFSTFDVLL